MTRQEQPITEMESAPQPVGCDAGLQEIDIAHYRTDELVDNISDLISIPSFISRILKFTFGAVFVSWIVIPWVFGNAIGVGWLIPLVMYGTVGALVVGVALGITYSLGRALSNMIQLADLTFHVTDQVVHDFRSLADGKKTWPSPRQFVVMVYDHVIIPSVEAAFERVFWFFGTCVMWAYKKTLGRIVRFMLKYTPAGNVGERPFDSTLSEGALNDLRENARHIWISTTRQWIQTLGTRLRWTVLFPFVVISIAVTVFTIAPLVVAGRWLLF